MRNDEEEDYGSGYDDDDDDDNDDNDDTCNPTS
jgi:hypothetical protein